MNDYSDLIFLIAAIAIYGMLVTNTNRTLVLNNQLLVDTEIEYGAISTAQDILDEARWMPYDEVTVPNLEAVYNETLYDDQVTVQPQAAADCPSSRPCKRVDVHISSDYLQNSDGSPRVITLSLIKTDYIP